MARIANRKKRSDGNYSKQITVGRKADGKPIRKTIYAKTLKELEIKAAEYERQLQQGTLSTNEKMTFGELAQLWLDGYKPTITINTRKKYHSLLNKHILPHLRMMKLKDLKPHHLQTIINQMAVAGYSEATMKEVKTTSAQILEVAVDNDMLFRNVFLKVTVPRKEATTRRPLTETEQALVTSTYAGHRMGVPALLMLYCGLRRGELLALTWSDVDLEKQEVNINKSVFYSGNAARIKEPKTKAGIRHVPLPNALIAPLRAARSVAQSMMVCPTITGKIMSHIAFKRAWESYMHYLNIAAGGKTKKRTKNNEKGEIVFTPAIQAVANLTPHMFRHTYATMLYDAGVDVKSAQKFMGHANVDITLKVYTHLSSQKEEQAVEALNQHFGDNLNDKSPQKGSDAVKMQ